MINNNPYNVPEKPLKQSKVVVQTNPLYPHQINRRPQDMEYKHHPQMMKRSTMPYFLQTTIKQPSRMPLSPQPVLKGQHLQVSTVTPWENNKQPSNVSIYRELSDRLSLVTQRIDLHQRKISMMMEVKKQEQSTTLSDSTFHSYQISNAFSSRQIERNSQFEGMGQISIQIAEKVKEQMCNLKTQREKYELRLKRQLKEEINEQKSLITKQLISNFRESLNQKFAVEQQKINNQIQQIMRIQDSKLQNAFKQWKEQLSKQIKYIREELKQKQNQQRYKIPAQIKQNIEMITNSFAEHRSQYLNFKDHVFKNILIIHTQQQSLLKINQKIQVLSKLIEKKQVNFYQGYINISSQRTTQQILKLNAQSYLNIISKNQNFKSKISEITYFIDTQGFLLDSNGFYILNSKGTKIKIEQSQIRRLRQLGIMK